MRTLEVATTLDKVQMSTVVYNGILVISPQNLKSNRLNALLTQVTQVPLPRRNKVLCLYLQSFNCPKCTMPSTQRQQRSPSLMAGHY